MAGTKKLIDLEEIQEIDFESVEAVETAPALEESVKEPVEAEPSLDELIKQDMIEQEVEEAEAEIKSEPVESVKMSKKTAESKVKAEIAKEVMEVAVEQSKDAKKEANRQYMLNKPKAFRERCKESGVVTFSPPKYCAQFFGPVYTFLVNCVSVSVKFDGTPQKFSKRVKEILDRKIAQVTESNIAKTVDLRIRG